MLSTGNCHIKQYSVAKFDRDAYYTGNVTKGKYACY